MSEDVVVTDEDLMAAFQSGDEEAFRTLFDRYAARLFNFSLRFFRSREDAEDAAQEVLLRVYHKKDRFDASRFFKPWVFTIASRIISNRLRDKKRHPHISLDRPVENNDGDEIVVEPSESPRLSPEKIEENIQLIQAVQRALEDLPQNQRTAVLLARFEEMSYEEIAESMSTTVSSVKSLLFRAKATLMVALKPFCPSDSVSEEKVVQKEEEPI